LCTDTNTRRVQISGCPSLPTPRSAQHECPVAVFLAGCPVCYRIRKCQSKHTVDRLNPQPAVRSRRITEVSPLSGEWLQSGLRSRLVAIPGSMSNSRFGNNWGFLHPELAGCRQSELRAAYSPSIRTVPQSTMKTDFPTLSLLAMECDCTSLTAPATRANICYHDEAVRWICLNM
jgi:hypothetical protein